MSDIFYVYTHHYKTGPKKGEIFYVGKGSGYRARNRHGRSKYWNRIKEKYGYYHEIIQSDMSEDRAFLLEEWLIAMYTHYGLRLCNMTSGGDGVSSNKPSIYCSNGMMFTSGLKAAEWVSMTKNGKPASRSSIDAACKTGRAAYGYKWSRADIFSPCDNIDYPTSKKIYCSNGKSFESGADAAKWVSEENGINATYQPICGCARGSNRSAYGYRWSHDPIFEPDFKREKVIRRVRCSNGMIFDNFQKAYMWATNGTGKHNGSKIRECAIGERGKAYGYCWYIDD